MVFENRKGERFYRVGNKYRVHGYDDDGRYRILRWETIAEDLREFDFQEGKDGKYRILEWTLHFIPTREGMSPSSFRNWEVRILAPQGVGKERVRTYAEDILADFTNYEMVETSNVEWVKEGIDVYEYSENKNVRYMIVDTTRPQYKYPKKRLWGEYISLMGGKNEE